MEREEAEDVGLLFRVERTVVERLVHRGAERVAVVAHRVRDAGIPSQGRALVGIVRELGAPRQEADRLLELVSSESELPRATEPGDGPCPQARQLGSIVAPRRGRRPPPRPPRRGGGRAAARARRIAAPPRANSPSAAWSRSLRALGIVP
jgi:hypothetical protein